MTWLEVALLVTLAASLIALGGVLWKPSTTSADRRPGDQDDSKAEATASREIQVAAVRQQLALPVGSSTVFGRDLVATEITPGQSLVIEDPNDPRHLIVIGGEGAASRFGEVVGVIPGQMAGMLVGADALVKAGIGVGEQSGTLVRVYADSAKALREGRKIYDASGRMLSVVQDANGKFSHVLRIAPATGMQALTAGTGVLSAVAMQAQLASIEKKIQEVLDCVRDLQATIDRHEQAQLDGLDRTLNDIYRGARASGVLTQSAWDQLAPLRKFIDEHHVSAELKVKALIDELERRKTTGDRRAWFKNSGPKLEKSLAQLAQAERALIQFESLRVWWLALTDDAAAGHYADQLQGRLTARRQTRSALESQTFAALEAARETWAWDFVHSLWDSSKVEPQAVRLRDKLRDQGLLDAHLAIDTEHGS